MKRKPILGLGAIALVLATGSILAEPGGAAQPADTITCTATTTTLTWVAGTTRVDYEWRDASNNVVATGFATPASNHPDSTQIDTPSNAATAGATFTPRHGLAERLRPVSCSS